MADLFGKPKMDKNSYEKKYIFSARVVSNKDPMMLNRVRVSFDVPIDGLNNQSVLDQVPNKYEGKSTKQINPETQKQELKPEFQWSKIDPFCFLPLLPVFLNITPKETESVNILWPNPEYKYSEQYYIPGPISSPYTIYKEESTTSRLFANKSRISETVQLRNPINSDYFNTKVEGVFPEYDDVAILGRGTCDLILREKHVLLRAGKSKITPKNANEPAESKINRGFIQISDFDERIIDLGTRLSNTLEQDVLFVNTLIEWNVINPENLQNKFNVEIFLYKLPDNTGYTTNRLKIATDVKESDKTLLTYMIFRQVSLNEGVQKINEFIKQVNDGKLNIDPYPIQNLDKTHPIVFRPNKMSYRFIKNGSDNKTPEYEGVNKFGKKIKFLGSGEQEDGDKGYGLIFFKNKVGQQFTVRKVKQKELDRTSQPTTYNILASDKMLLLSHDSKIPSLGKIVLDEKTMYGIEQQYIVQNIIPNTNSMVRGEELFKFLSLVVRFLVSHVHPFPGIPPIPVSTDGVSAQDILSQLQNATGTILNENLRIN